ncbi:hypothetical protein HK096_005317, partial [Nowakowskiella sp. JEL0078]
MEKREIPERCLDLEAKSVKELPKILKEEDFSKKNYPVEIEADVSNNLTKKAIITSTIKPEQILTNPLTNDGIISPKRTNFENSTVSNYEKTIKKSTSSLCSDIDEDFEFESESESGTNSSSESLIAKNNENNLRHPMSGSSFMLPKMIHVDDSKLPLSKSSEFGSPVLFDGLKSLKKETFITREKLKELNEEKTTEVDNFKEIKVDSYSEKNLNKLSDAELTRIKKNMDIEFEKNRIKPEDAGFSYDIQ